MSILPKKMGETYIFFRLASYSKLNQAQNFLHTQKFRAFKKGQKYTPEKLIWFLLWNSILKSFYACN